MTDTADKVRRIKARHRREGSSLEESVRYLRSAVKTAEESGRGTAARATGLVEQCAEQILALILSKEGAI